MPDALAGVGVESQQSICKEIIANTIAPIEIKGSRTCRHINDPSLGIQRHAAPVIGRAGGLPRRGWPCFIPELTWMRDGMEAPAKFSRANIERTNISRWRGKSLGHFTAYDDEILVNNTGRR